MPEGFKTCNFTYDGMIRNRKVSVLGEAGGDDGDEHKKM
jgi:hypothetical protein